MLTRNTNLCFVAISWLDVVHDVDVDIVKNDVDTAIYPWLKKNGLIFVELADRLLIASSA